MKTDLLVLPSPQLDRAITPRVLSSSTLSWMWCAKRPRIINMLTTLGMHVVGSNTHGELPAMQRLNYMYAYVM